MLKIEEITQRINQGGSVNTEFKDTDRWSDEIGVSIVAFANDYENVGGGILLMGIAADGVISGFAGDYNNLENDILNYCRDKCHPIISPQVHLEEIEGKRIVIIEVKRSEKRPHRFNNVCYLRSGSTNRSATFVEELGVAEKLLQMPFDKTLVENARFLDLNLEKIKQFLLDSKLKQLDPQHQQGLIITEELLQQFDLIKKRNDAFIPTVTAVLCFANNTQQFFPHSTVEIIQFDGTTVTANCIDQKTIEGNLDEIVNKAINYFARNLYISSIFDKPDLNRYDFFEYSSMAIGETILNAVVHRDYRHPGMHVYIKIFSDRLEVTSPGGLEPPLVREQFGKGYVTLRNPTLAQVFRESKNLAIRFEKAGTGIPKIRKAMRQNGSPRPEFEIADSFIRVTIPANSYQSEKRAMEKSFGSDVTAWRSFAIRQKRGGDFSRASIMFQKITELESSNARNWLERGQLEIKLRHWRLAKALLESALQQPNPPKHVEGWIHRDLAYVLSRLKGTLEEQEEHLRIAIEINPGDKGSLISYQKLLERMKRWDEVEVIKNKINELMGKK